MTESLTCAIGRLRPHHFGISVPDLDEALSWYERMLGFSVEQRLFIDEIPAHIAFVKLGDFRIEIFQVEGAAALPSDRRVPNLDVRTHGNKHMCFEVPDMAAAISALRAAGADIALEVTIDGNPTAFVRDCAGNLLEFLQPLKVKPVPTG